MCDLLAIPGTESDIDPPEPVACVYFVPPLHSQRQIWALNQLRRIRATSVIDLGCGEGVLLSALIQPSSIYPPTFQPPDPVYELDDPEGETSEIHLQRVIGLDLERSCVDATVEALTPLTEDDIGRMSDWSKPRPRFLKLTAEVFCGGLEILNDAMLGDWDAIVSTEVVEHLPHDILDHFFPMTLGVYHPKHLFITTPNYNFNQLFTPPGIPNDKTGFPDPTGQTDRIFRHDDHKREWKEEEWKIWCQEGADRWDYDVEVGSLGVAHDPDPWGRADLAGRASLTASFTRREDPTPNIEERRRRALSEARRRSRRSNAHELAARFEYPSSPCAGKPRSDKEILRALQKVYWDEGKNGVDDAWALDNVARACGGMPTALFGAIDRSPKGEYQLVRQEKAINHRWKERFWSWTIVWHGWEEPKVEDRPPEPQAWWDNTEEEELENDPVHTTDTVESTTATPSSDWWGSAEPAWGLKTDTVQTGGWGAQTADIGAGGTWGQPASGWGAVDTAAVRWGAENAWSNAVPKA